MAPLERVSITVAYALPERQSVVALQVPPETTALEVVQQSGLLIRYPDIGARPLQLAIFGHRIAPTTPVREGDRVEILRPLPQDPRDRRRELARQGRTMGRNRG